MSDQDLEHCGFYWIRLGYGWTPAEWDGKRGWWGVLHSSRAIETDDVLEVGDRIYPPDHPRLRIVMEAKPVTLVKLADDTWVIEAAGEVKP